VKGFIKVSEASSTALIPFFCTTKSNQAFVQDMDKDFVIRHFAPFDMSIISHDQIVTLKRGAERSVGDPGLIAILLADFGVIHGSRDEVVAGLRNFGSYSELPEFLHLEIADLLDDPAERAAAIRRGRRTFSNKALGTRWAARQGPSPSGKHEPARKSGGDRQLTFETAWKQIQGQLRRDCGARTFDGWLRPIRLGVYDEESGTLHLELPTQFMADFVQTHFADRLSNAWKRKVPRIKWLKIQVSGVASSANTSESAEAADTSEDTGKRDNSRSRPFDTKYRFENFVVGHANEVAFAAARTLATAANVAFNPLFIHGATGSGKTHLLHAIGHEFRRLKPKAKVIYISAERFMLDFVQALRENKTLQFKKRLRSADLLLVDDIQFIAGRESGQEEFLNTINEVMSAGRLIAVASGVSPQDLDGIEPRILSRLAWGLVADINRPDLELRLNIISKKLEALPNIEMPEEVVMFLAKRISSNARELEGALNRIAAYAAMQNRVIDLDFVGEVLASTLRANQRRVSIDEIQAKVADLYRIRKGEMTSQRRAREVALPRQVAMYLARQLTPRSLPEIGRRFGGRDANTVIHAIRRIEKLRAQDPELDTDIRLLTRQLEV
jgi:chromosomal replication initiator protein